MTQQATTLRKSWIKTTKKLKYSVDFGGWSNVDDRNNKIDPA